MDITNIPIKSIMKSGNTQSPSLPSHVSSPPPPVAPSQLSHSLPAKPSSHCPCSPAYASQCTVSSESSPPCSDNELTAAVGASPHTGRNTRASKVVTFTNIITQYSAHGNISFNSASSSPARSPNHKLQD